MPWHRSGKEGAAAFVGCQHMGSPWGHSSDHRHAGHGQQCPQGWDRQSLQGGPRVLPSPAQLLLAQLCQCGLAPLHMSSRGPIPHHPGLGNTGTLWVWTPGSCLCPALHALRVPPSGESGWPPGQRDQPSAELLPPTAPLLRGQPALVTPQPLLCTAPGSVPHQQPQKMQSQKMQPRYRRPSLAVKHVEPNF